MRICQHGDEHSAWSVAHWLFTPAIGRRAQYLQGSLPSLLATGSLSNSVRTELVFDIGKTIRRASETFERTGAARDVEYAGQVMRSTRLRRPCGPYIRPARAQSGARRPETPRDPSPHTRPSRQSAALLRMLSGLRFDGSRISSSPGGAASFRLMAIVRLPVAIGQPVLDAPQLTRLNFSQGGQDCWHEGAEMDERVRWLQHEDHAECSVGEVLLECHALVHRDQSAELPMCSTQQLAVCDTGPPETNNRFNIVPGQLGGEIDRNVFVKKNAHRPTMTRGRDRAPPGPARASRRGIGEGNRPAFLRPPDTRTERAPVHECRRRPACRR